MTRCIWRTLIILNTFDHRQDFDKVKCIRIIHCCALDKDWRQLISVEFRRVHDDVLHVQFIFIIVFLTDINDMLRVGRRRGSGRWYKTNIIHRPSSNCLTVAKSSKAISVTKGLDNRDHKSASFTVIPLMIPDSYDSGPSSRSWRQTQVKYID